MPFLLLGLLSLVIVGIATILVGNAAEKLVSGSTMDIRGQVLLQYSALVVFVSPLRVWIMAALTAKRLRDIGIDPHNAFWMVGAGAVSALIAHLGISSLEWVGWLCFAVSLGSTLYLLLKPGKSAIPKPNTGPAGPAHSELQHPAYARERQGRPAQPAEPFEFAEEIAAFGALMAEAERLRAVTSPADSTP